MKQQTFSDIEYSGRNKRFKDNGGQDWARFIENRESSVRGKVEHLFRFLKVQYGFRKTVYRVVKKNLNRMPVLYSLAEAGHSLAVDWERYGRSLPIGQKNYGKKPSNAAVYGA